MKCELNHILSNAKYTYMSKINGDNSYLDHFLVTNNLFNTIVDYRSLHDVDNLSDHEALQMRLQIPINYLPDTGVAHKYKKTLSDKASLSELHPAIQEHRDVFDS